MVLTLFSPAKINLFLRVLGRRSDGYHELASLFQAIDLGDILTISFAEDDLFTCSDFSLACDRSNLVMKAVDLFRLKTHLDFKIRIHLEKKIPMQAGLGGGSSNAATTLWGLNALHHHLVPESTLQDWSAEIGSDIPFFFSEGTAYCRGRGEIVEDLPKLSLPKSLSLVKPKEGLSTVQIFKELNLEECSKEDPDKILSTFFTDEPYYVNDLEKPAFRLCPVLSTLRDRLLQDERSKAVFMTGSGTAFFSFRENTPIINETYRTTAKFIRRSQGTWYF